MTTATEPTGLDDYIASGRAWVRVLDCTVEPTSATVLRPVAEHGHGNPTGPPLGPPIYGPGDPLWRPESADEFRYIGELAPSHRLNLWRFLCRRASSITSRCMWADALADPFGGDNGGNLDNARAEAEEWAMDHPHAWLLGTRFMRALAALLIGDGNGETVARWEAVAEGRAKPPKRRPRGIVGPVPDWLGGEPERDPAYATGIDSADDL